MFWGKRRNNPKLNGKGAKRWVKYPFFIFLIINKTKMEKNGCKCPHCEKRQAEDAENEEVSLAVLLAMVPMLVMTVFGQMGIL